MTIEARLIELGIELPAAASPAGNYASAVRSGQLLFLAGKASSRENGKFPKGKLGRDYTTADGYRFARTAALELVAVVKATIGSLNKVSRIVELQGFINATDDFEEHPQVLDGASDVLVQIFGERGVHARSVLGAVSLRGGLPVVLRAVVEIADD